MASSKQIIGRTLWGIAVLTALLAYALYPEQFGAEGIAATLTKHHEAALLTYLAVSVTRGLFLLPSTPFVLAGVLLFPDEFSTVFLISMAGVLSGSAIVYLFSDSLGFADSLLRRHKHLYTRIAEKMAHHGTPIVVLWAFFPAVPTDLISCIAGTTKMEFWRFLAAIGIGESILVALYVSTGQALLPWIRSIIATL